MEVLIVGAGIGGLTLGLMLQRAGIPCRIFEAAPEIKPLGVGINVLPHASQELCGLGLEPALTSVSMLTRESVFFTRFGQFIYREPAGRYAGYEWPQFSIHRGDLQQVLLDAFIQRAGAERLLTGWRCTGAEQDGSGVTVRFEHPITHAALPPQRGTVVVGCEGLHSVLRKQLHPAEGEPVYSGVNMWRGTTRWPPFLSGASMTRVGWLAVAKMVIYPIRDAIDGPSSHANRQLVNWVVEIETPQHQTRDWTRQGRLEDFIGAIADWRFDWLDVPAFIRAADMILEYPMVPRGSNGAGQAILDCRALTECLAACLQQGADPEAALAEYERRRLGPTTNVVLTNRRNPPDAILREVYLRSGDKPFADIGQVISPAELQALSTSYKRVAGYDQEQLRAGGAPAVRSRL